MTGAPSEVLRALLPEIIGALRHGPNFSLVRDLEAIRTQLATPPAPQAATPSSAQGDDWMEDALRRAELLAQHCAKADDRTGKIKAEGLFALIYRHGKFDPRPRPNRATHPEQPAPLPAVIEDRSHEIFIDDGMDGPAPLSDDKCERCGQGVEVHGRTYPPKAGSAMVLKCPNAPLSDDARAVEVLLEALAPFRMVRPLRKARGPMIVPAAAVDAIRIALAGISATRPTAAPSAPLEAGKGGDAVAEVIAEMMSIAPTCENDWDQQLREWARTLKRAAPPTPARSGEDAQ